MAKTHDSLQPAIITSKGKSAALTRLSQRRRAAFRGSNREKIVAAAAVACTVPPAVSESTSLEKRCRVADNEGMSRFHQLEMEGRTEQREKRQVVEAAICLFADSAALYRWQQQAAGPSSLSPSTRRQPVAQTCSVKATVDLYKVAL